jgi:hypothetical protein
MSKNSNDIWYLLSFSAIAVFLLKKMSKPKVEPTTTTNNNNSGTGTGTGVLLPTMTGAEHFARYLESVGQTNKAAYSRQFKSFAEIMNSIGQKIRDQATATQYQPELQAYQQLYNEYKDAVSRGIFFKANII